MESIPVLIISGQARYVTTVRGMGLKLRSTGIQEYDIVKSAAPMTKYAVMIEKKEDVRYCTEKALYLMKSGRRGPVWLDVPLDVQGAMIDPDTLRGYDPEENPEERIKELDHTLIGTVADRLREAKRPVLFGGFGVRASGAVMKFRELASLLGIPVLTGMSSVDLVAKHRYMEPKKGVYDIAFLNTWGNNRNLDTYIGFFDDMLWEAVYAASLAPSYLNRQAYGFLLRDGEISLVKRPDLYNTDLDGDLSLGIVLLHFTAVAENWSGKLNWRFGYDAARLNLPEGHQVMATCSL
jgi:glyoxylate carboligase